jgi:Bacterial membrane protein YfhO
LNNRGGMPASDVTAPPRSQAVGSPRLAGLRGWLRRRPTAAAAIAYAVLSVLLYAPALVPGHTLSASDYLWSAAPWASERPADVRPFGSNYELVDSVTQFQPWLQYSRQRLPHAPLWNSHVAVGRPYLANAQSAVLSPFSLPGYVLPFWWSLGLIAALKVFVAAFGTYLLARALGMRPAGALLAGLVYAFSLYFVVWITWPQSSVWAFLPWAWLMADRVVRDPAPLPVAGLALVVALQFFAGHPESSFHLLTSTLVFFAFRLLLLRRRRAVAGVWRPLLAFAIGLLAGTALAAVTLVPFLQLLSHSSDVQVRQTYARLALQPRYLLGFVLPDYWGRATHTAVGAFAQERALYVGALPLVLALAALVGRPSLQRLAVAAFGLLMLAIALGAPPFPDLAEHVPIVKTGNHLRVVVIAVLCLALLAGWGLDDLSARRIRRSNVVLAAVLGLLVLPTLILVARGQLSGQVLGRAFQLAAGQAWPSPPADGRDLATIRMAALIVWLVFMGLAFLLIAARVRLRLAAGTFAVLAVALVAADLFKAGMGATPAISTAAATQPSTPGIEYLRSRRPNRFVGLDRPLGPSPLVPDMALRWSLYDARSYDLPVERRYDRLWRRAVLNGGPSDTPTTGARLTARSLRAFRLLSVTDVVQDPSEPPVRRPALPLAYERRDLRVYANAGAMPRAGVVAAQRVARGDGAQLDAVLAPGFDARRSVVTPSPLPGLPRAPGGGTAGRARIVRYEPERVVVDATAHRPGELVLTDADYPGWQATVDGKPSPVHRVDYLLRGTTLSPGKHRVEFRYRPASWRAGWIISLVTLAGLLLAVAAGLRARRRPPARHA